MSTLEVRGFLSISKEWRVAVLLKENMCNGVYGTISERVNQFSEWLRKSGLDVGQGKLIGYDLNEWQGFVRGNVCGSIRVMSPWLQQL